MKRKPDLPNAPSTAGTIEEGHLLTPDELARTLRVRVKTLREWRRAAHPRGPSFVRVEGRVRYPLQAIQEYLAEHTVRVPSAPFYCRMRIEQLGEKHPGLQDLVEEQERRRVPYPQIAAAILEKWNERVSDGALSNFYRLRVWPKEWNDAREANVKTAREK